MIKYLIQKEFLQIRRNSFLPKLIVMFPIMIMCVMPWVMNMEVKNIVVDVVDNDRSTLSQQIVHSIEASRYFIFNGQKPTYKAALTEIEHGEADAVLVIPQHYGRDVTKAHAEGAAHLPSVLIAANAVNGTKGSMGSAYLSQIVNEELRMKNEESPAVGKAVANSLFYTLHSSFLYNKHQNYKLYMIPALLAIVMMLMTGFLPTLNIVGEKETGTIEQINVTPVSKWAFILSKLIPYWLIALFVITVCLVLAWLIYGITSAGSLWLVYVLAMLLALFFSSFGLIISNYSETMQQAMFVMWFFIVCIMLLSGLFTPTRSMPDWAYSTTYVNPMHYFIDAIRTVFIRGGGFRDVAHQVFALLGIGIFMAVWAVSSYKKNN